MTEQYALTYPEPDGTATAGHSGTTTSRDRAVKEARDGTAAMVQSRVLHSALDGGLEGVTIAELRRLHPDHHHGSLSSALTNLHRVGELACLMEKRDRCHVYVRPDRVNGRDTRQPVRRKPAASESVPEGHAVDLQALAADSYDIGHDDGWKEGYDQGVEAAQKRPGALLEAKHLGIVEGREQQAKRTLALIANMREQVKGKGPVEAHSATCWQRHSKCAIDAIAKAQVISK
jgi:hypothetical protein